ncbi:MAG TPA: DUF2779 domain-containing protein [Pyrinomonadaceae bacterium]|nr:DUF2779 domain-containing protein [Pyrinomonadaceae bacterium]
MNIPQGTDRKQRLSKSDYLAGLQCPKHLWLRVNEPEAAELEVDQNLEALFEQGRRVGELARTYVPGGTLIDFPYYAVDDKLTATKRALDEGREVIYEAAFAADDQFVTIDILERTPEGFVVTEVKSSTKVKNEHVQELALQADILRECGIPVLRFFVMHINRECVYPNLENLFVRKDVTEQVTELQTKVAEARKSQKETLASSLPVVQIGPQCLAPSECPFKDRCWADVPEHHVTTISGIRAKKAFELVEAGFTTITELPVDFRLSSTAERQRRAVVEERLIVEPTLDAALEAFPSSLGFLDFETVGLAIPVWDGCRPYDAVPVQFSFCRLQPDGTLMHSEWLADGPDDPREPLALALIESCRNVETIIAYNASFEARALTHLAEARPNLANELESIKARLVDLLPMVRDHVYDPEFNGKFGLKQVLPALLGVTPYENLEISDGDTASWSLRSLMFERDKFTPDEISRMRNSLEEYCSADTESLARLLSVLRSLGSSSAETSDSITQSLDTVIV